MQLTDPATDPERYGSPPTRRHSRPTEKRGRTAQILLFSRFAGLAYNPARFSVAELRPQVGTHPAFRRRRSPATPFNTNN